MGTLVELPIERVAVAQFPAPRRPAQVAPVPGRGSGRPGQAELRRQYDSTPLRLTRRGRIVLVMAVAITLLLAVAALAGQPSEASNQAGGSDAYRYVTVQPGQTLWAIAEEAAPDQDPRVTVRRILRLNALQGGTVQAGQRIAVPIR